MHRGEISQHRRVKGIMRLFGGEEGLTVFSPLLGNKAISFLSIKIML
jgi:hypothetical protein